uniref:Uncharacterized protein n=1 Tax=Dendroctonus ponderosae TaxID=77166 RepID=A0AAR5PSA3_DENPD
LNDLRRRPGLCKKDISIGTLNVLSWYRPGSAQKSIVQIKEIGKDITAIEKIRWTDSGTRGSENLLCLKVGVGTNTTNLELVLSFTGKWYNYSLLSIHAPTEEKDEITKKALYDELERTLHIIPQTIHVNSVGSMPG